MGQHCNAPRFVNQLYSFLGAHFHLAAVGRLSLGNQRIKHRAHRGKQPFLDQHPGNMRPAQALGAGSLVPHLRQGQGIAQTVDFVYDPADPVNPPHPVPGHGLKQRLIVRAKMVAQHMDVPSIIIGIYLHSPEQFQGIAFFLDIGISRPKRLDIVMVRNGNGVHSCFHRLVHNLLGGINSV